MGDPATAARRQQAGQQSWLAQLLTLPFRFLGVLLGSLLLSVLIECVGMHLFWQDESWHHAEKMLNHELDQLSNHFKRSMLVAEPAQLAQRVVTRAYTMLFARSHTKDDSARPSLGMGSGSRFKQLISIAYDHIQAYVLAALYTLLTFLVRLIVLVLTLPLFLMSALVGLIDGLVRRDLRKFGAGRESGFLYHRARATLTPLAVAPWMLYLALPVSIHPLAVLLPSAILLGLATNITAGSFKKYL